MKPINLVALLPPATDLAPLRDAGFIAWHGRSWTLALVEGATLGDVLIPDGTEALLLNGWEEGGLERGETRIMCGAGGRRLAPFYVMSSRPINGPQARFATPGSILAVTVDGGSLVTLELYQLVKHDGCARLDVTELWSGDGDSPRHLLPPGLPRIRRPRSLA